ncbi:hypothetical protein DFQ01_102332 [Paenibacillus cellulosilyticus]|uniref:Uncharacterized protein n=1 Tax=Paenibacillus cellulosilyticus TaxID=375489 RepID=A0A2V2YYW3_9BACL|nr:hypothetical protein [Paenibacillus cellulosilyticus]PWW07438.1 hypothetical protein DFQ01_102332 [Paenibacillus cellulosilyticus]QKS44402.1 hypothetical protein HUB94_08225 [Paenibacillus cellulosilyticus]
MTPYRAAIGEQHIVWGNQINVDQLAADNPPADSLQLSHQGECDWDLQPGIYYAKDIVRELDTLLEVISIRLGDAADPEALHRNIEASLAISGRESVLSLASADSEVTSRTELSKQADLIGRRLADWAREFSSQQWARSRCSAEALSSLLIRSRCDHHLWTPRVTDLLMGPLGGPIVMQLFNEYLHQIVLLRDALLPFDNWEEVPIELRADSSGKGLRYTEQARAQFLTELLVKQVSHQSIVRYAQAVLAPSLAPVGYGFQYRLGTILPASLTSNLATTTKYLLRWYPVYTTASNRISDPIEQLASVAFVYAYDDYYTAPRSQIGQGEPTVLNEHQASQQEDASSEARLHAFHTDGQTDRVQLQYQLQLRDTNIAVDLGQLLRGHRFVYHTEPNSQHAPSLAAIQEPAQPVIYSAQELLQQPGLVTSDAGIHLIETGGDPLIQRAVLGKLYPENVILLDRSSDEQLHAARQSGKGFGAKFLLH